MDPTERQSNIQAIALLDQMLTEIIDGNEEAFEAARNWMVDIAQNGHNAEVVTMLRAWREFLERRLNE
jgi:hypothetical protein